MTAWHPDLLVHIFLLFVLMVLLVYIGKKIIEKQRCRSGCGSRKEEMAKRRHVEDEAGPSITTSKQGTFKFNVFISFRGKDTRKGFTSHLHKELKNRGISTFIDSEDLIKGQRIIDLFKNIEESKIFVPVFSKNYADSKWCLMEITKMVEINKMNGQDRPIIPIFYDIDPSDVRHCRASLRAAFEKHQRNKELGEKKINKWKAALTEAGNISGYSLSQTEESEAKLITLVGKQVSTILSKVPFDIQPIGIDRRIQTLKQMLERRKDGVCMIGICGEGGIGKTTISKALYNELSAKYEGSCFLSDVRESAKKDGIPSLQAKLMSEVLNENMPIADVEQGISLMKQRIGCKKLLLILDDVDHIDQLKAFTAHRRKQEEWFSVGSKIIVTTRNKDVLLQHGLKEEEIFLSEELDLEHSLQLFSRHAFVSDRPVAEFHELSKEAVTVTGGLPLAVVVFGSLFYDIRDKQEWKEMLEMLKLEHHKDVHEKLRISYEALNQREKCIFLDIACLFLGEKKEYPIYMWEGCGYSPGITLKVLQHRSLIKINVYGRFEMHDQIRDMGRWIVRQEGNLDPMNYSRLWDADDISRALNTAEVCSGNDHLHGFKVGGVCLKQRLSWNTISAMPKLRMILDASGNTFEDGEIWLPGNTRWLSFSFCPMKTLSFHNTQHEQLVVLQLWGNDFRELGSHAMAFPKLKVLDLGGCKKLILTPDFTLLPCLKKLVLDWCESLAEIDESIGHLKKLTFLSMKDCTKLRGLPARLCERTALEFLDVNGCKNVEVLPEQIGDLKCLKDLRVGMTSITEIPVSIGRLEFLENLSLYSCEEISFLPKEIGGLKSLRALDLGRTSIAEVPDSIGGLAFLQWLDLHGCSRLRRIPDSIGGLTRLSQLILCHCSTLEQLPDSIKVLTSLSKLDLDACESLREVPDSLGGLQNLSDLSLRGCISLEKVPNFIRTWVSSKSVNLDDLKSLKRLPDSLGDLKCTLKLSLRGCQSLEGIPDFICRMESLRDLDLSGCTSLKRIPECIGNLKNLRSLRLKHCHSLEVLPESIGSLQSLEVLHIDGGKLKKVPDFIGKLENLRRLHLRDIEEISDLIAGLPQLKKLWVKHSRRLKSLPQLPSSLVCLRVVGCNDLKKTPNVSSLKDVSELFLKGYQGLNDLPGLESLKSLQILQLAHSDGLASDLMNRLSQASFERLRSLLISGAVEVPHLQFEFPKGRFIKYSYLRGWFSLTEEPLIDCTSPIKICIQVLADGKIISERSRKAHKIEVVDAEESEDEHSEESEDEDSEESEDEDSQDRKVLGLELKAMYRIEFELDDEMRNYVGEGQEVMVRIPTTYHGYQLRRGHFLLKYSHHESKYLSSRYSRR